MSSCFWGVKTIVFGVRHGVEYLDETLEAIIPTISESAVVGLEVEPASVALFERLRGTSTQDNLESAVLRHHGIHSGTIEEDYQGARMILFHYRMHCALRDRGCSVFGFDTQQRILYPHHPVPEQHPNLQILSVAVGHEEETTFAFQLMITSWFNRYAANVIRYHHTTHAVIGSVHAPVVSRLVNGNCIMVSPPYPDLFEDCMLLEEAYKHYAKHLPPPSYSPVASSMASENR